MTAAEVTFARLRATDPARWQAAALAWRRWATAIGRWVAELGDRVAGLAAAWSGVSGAAAAAHLSGLRRRLELARLTCWAADQTLSEFAAALVRARALLDRATESARRANLTIDDLGVVHPPMRPPDPAAPLLSAFRHAADRQAVAETSAGLSAALTVAATADRAAAGRLSELAEAAAAPPPPATALPPPTASPAEVRRWWDALTPAQRHWLTATEPGWLGPREGVPAAYRDLANRLRFETQRAELDRAITGASGAELDRLRGLRDALDGLGDRLDAPGGPRAYLLGLETAGPDRGGEGRVVLALGDPGRADHVLTHVPGMTADLASATHELSRAERVADRAGQLDPAASTSAVLWLGYDAPDSLGEAAGRRLAEAGGPELRRFQEGLRAEGAAAHLTLLGHSYGSLVVGAAAAEPGLAADDVVFVGSPGVGTDSVAGLRLPSERVWSTTSVSDVIQYLPVAPDGLAKDLALSRALPIAGPLIAFGRPEDELWHGTNPSDPAFGARVFASQPQAGHLGYWDPERPALDALAAITVGRGDDVRATRP